MSWINSDLLLVQIEEFGWALLLESNTVVIYQVAVIQRVVFFLVFLLMGWLADVKIVCYSVFILY